jgi:hypothetical protein
MRTPATKKCISNLHITFFLMRYWIYKSEDPDSFAICGIPSSQVSSKLTPITSHDDAVEGLVTHGWITAFADFGCFVSFYNDVKALAHR